MKANKRSSAAAQEQVEMIGNQRPRIDRGFGLESQITETITESLPIAVAHKDGSALDAPHHDVVKHSHSIKSGPRGIPRE